MSGLTVPFTGLKKQYNNLRNHILDATDEVLRSGCLMNGNNTAEFESWLAKKNHCQYAVTVGSGTAALECLAEFFLETQPMPNPPTVLIPSLTYAATANAFQRAGWDVHFVDVDRYGLLDCNKVPDISYQAVVIVGLYGASVTHLGDAKSWQHWILSDRIIIEDAAQNWLAADCTRIGQGSAISFDPMKNLPCYGNGGAVVTNNTDLFQFARAWRDAGKPSYTQTGTNSRMSEVDCAQMLVKTQHIDQWQIRRAKISNYYYQKLNTGRIACLTDDSNSHDHSYHKFVIDVDNRDLLSRNLALRNIETKIHYQHPLHEHSIFRQWPGPDMLSCATALSRRVLSLPIYPELTDLQVEYVVDQVLDCVNS
jgi:dTDP-4-amino-4,6-dideoxygalactose transaminase